MNLAWLTDIHLNLLGSDTRRNFYKEIIATQCDAILISGDIAEAPCLTEILNEMAKDISKPIYFVLGNHDYYGSQINEVRKIVIDLTQKNHNLLWLSALGIEQLNNEIFIVGEDGWADGRLGDYQNSKVILHDSRLIADLFQEKICGKFKLLEKMQQLADKDAINLKQKFEDIAIKNPKKIIVLTHVPPFKEACLHMGKVSDDNWLPYFSSKAMGDVLLNVAKENLSIEFVVLCGHTHSQANYRASDNLTIKVGKAEYNEPIIQELIIV